MKKQLVEKKHTSGSGPGHRFIRSVRQAEPRRTREGGRQSKLEQQFFLRKLLPFSHLWLVANRSHTAVIDEGENAFGVVSGDELCWLTNVVHVCAVGRAGDLRGKTGTVLSNLARAAFSRAASPAVGSVAIGEHLQAEEFSSLDFQGKAVLHHWKMLLTWSLPIATRQNLLSWPASGSSSGSETPKRSAKKFQQGSYRKNYQFRRKKDIQFQLQYISPPCFVIQYPFP